MTTKPVIHVYPNGHTTQELRDDMRAFFTKHWKRIDGTPVSLTEGCGAFLDEFAKWCSDDQLENDIPTRVIVRR
jgi:hypothetical protein